ncbi:hypothetical protein AYL99_11885 [Fonsecaea erecta]|uniref:Uncharacterized protein n=1 Tax=Fonsecaea erecta TaxID=1367422 RepID=A0A178Z3T8_9EURO|nr:hypothetical protein AYL99_11885 [Fonsecaea erecta]OAP53863.1 hypothetical protein AYL99_11885 [Fonsecaea erecta]
MDFDVENRTSLHNSATRNNLRNTSEDMTRRVMTVVAPGMCPECYMVTVMLVNSKAYADRVMVTNESMRLNTKRPTHTFENHYMTVNMIVRSVEDDRSFLIRRVVISGSTITRAPMVVACEWIEVKLENVFTLACRSEDLTTVTGCTMTAYMIPFGFATGNEQRYSDAAMVNSEVCSGDKSADDVANYCLDRIKGRRGILRKQCNSTRPPNTMRFAFDKGVFLFMSEDGKFSTVKLREEDLVMYGWEYVRHLDAEAAELEGDGHDHVSGTYWR